MADDLVASLTMRLRDEMGGGVADIRAEFTGLKDEIGRLTSAIQGLQGKLDVLTVPAKMQDGFDLARRNADAVTAAVASIGEAANSSAADIGRMAVKLDEAGRVRGVSVTPRGQPAPQENPRGHGGLGYHTGVADIVTGAIGGEIALDAIRKQADFQNPLLHTAITEQLSGPAALKEVSRLATQMQNLALNTATSSQELAEADLFLVTTGMDKKLIAEMMPALATTSTAYNVPVSGMTQAAFTLNENLGIDAKQMGPALAMLAYAGKIGHFSLADFGLLLPEVGGQINKLGMRGEPAEATTAAALEIIRRNTGQSGQAATNLTDLASYITSPMGIRMFDQTKRMRDLMGKGAREVFDKYHIQPLNLPAYLNAEREKGVDPINAMVDYFHQALEKIKSPTDRATVVGGFLHNLQAQNAMLALTQYYDDFKADQKKLSQVNPQVVATDFATAMQGDIVQVRLFDEEIAQLERDVGQGLMPLLRTLNSGLRVMITGINDLNALWKPFDVGLGNVITALGAAWLGLKAMGVAKGAATNIMRTAAGGAAPGAAAGAEGAATATTATYFRALIKGAILNPEISLPIVAAIGLGVENSKVVAEQVRRNTEAIDRNTAAHEKFKVVGPGMLMQDGPAGPVMIPVPHSVLPMQTPPHGPVLGRP